MTDVFINYRHEDGHGASRLRALLDESFDVFMDTRLEAGASLSTDIMLALSEARIVLAVIGPAWKDPRNLRRLRDPNDWIRRELLTAFAHNGTLVIPVLLDAVMPSAAELPAELALLTDSLAAELRFNKWDADAEALIDQIGRLLDKPLHQVVSRKPMPLDLPYLCDRVLQEDDLADLAAEHQQNRSLVCVVHGHKWEAHAGFMSRLRQLKVLEDLFSAPKDGIGIDTYTLMWNPDLAKAGQHVRALRKALKRALLKELNASDEQLAARLRTPGRPAVMQLQITEAALNECGASLPADFQKAWNQIITELGTAPAHFLALWQNLTYEDPAGDLPSEAVLPALAKLNPVDDGDIGTWMNLEEVKKYIVLRETAIANLTAEERMHVAPGVPRIHMQRFVDEVRILTQIDKRKAE